MSLRLETSVEVRASAGAVWARLTDWASQSDWIPLTTVTVVTPTDEGDAAPMRRVEGLGVHVRALSGFQVGPLPVGLLDRFVVTGWTPPAETDAGVAGRSPVGELEVLHLGPYFTGPGVFRVEWLGPVLTRVTCTEVFDIPGGRPVEAAASLLLPVMRFGLRRSLRKLGRLLESER